MFLTEDIMYKIYTDYIFVTNICRKNINKNVFINKYIYELYKKISKCNIIELEKIKLCTNHEKNTIKYITELQKKIDYYYYKLNNTNIQDEFIHCINMNNYKEITEKIVEKNDLEIEYYCCGGKGFKLKNNIDIDITNITNINDFIKILN